MPYWGVWNEPDGSVLLGNRGPVLRHVCGGRRSGSRLVNSALKVGGPGYTGSGANFTVWIHDFIAYCKAN